MFCSLKNNKKQRRILPGFGITLGFTLLYLGILVILPLVMLVLTASSLSWDEFLQIITAPRAVAAYRLSFGASFIAAIINAIFGSLLAWVLVRYRFFGRKIIDALIDLPFALPTAVAGITLVTLYRVPDDPTTITWYKGGLGYLIKEYLGINVAPGELGVIVALVFIGIPFVVRTLQPVLADLEPELEEAAACMGAGRFRIFCNVIFPTLLPSLFTGFSLAFARALGEYGSVVFIAGNMPLKTEILPLLIMIKLEEPNGYAAAAALALVMLLASFLIMLMVNFISLRAGRRALKKHRE
ncbi:MAG: sulfate ABC transporter permease subunit CysT [Bdellovibrionota bacterium]|jgi:sulfate transport system permease protein